MWGFLLAMARAADPQPAEAEPVEAEPAEAEPAEAEPAVIEVHWSEARPKSRVEGEYPDEARSLYSETVDCEVRVTLSPAGVPLRVEPVSCPEVFVAPTVATFMKWRFYPVMVDGEPATVAFRLRIKYVPPESDRGSAGDVTWGRFGARVAANPDFALAEPTTAGAGEASLAFGAQMKGVSVDVGVGYRSRGGVVVVRLGAWTVPAWDVSPTVALRESFAFLGQEATIYHGAAPEVGLGARIGQRVELEAGAGLEWRWMFGDGYGFQPSFWGQATWLLH